MTRSSVAMLVGVLVAATVGGTISYALWADQLPPRTPAKVARVVSELPIPRGAEVIHFEDHWSAKGDGGSVIRLQLSEPQIAAIIAEAQRAGYVSIPRTGLPGTFRGVPDNASGLYRLTGDQRNGAAFGLTVIDVPRAQIIVVLSVG